MESVEFLGHIISAEGVLPNEKKVEAVLAAPTPKDVSQVRSFLGLMKNFFPTSHQFLLRCMGCFTRLSNGGGTRRRRTHLGKLRSY